MEGVSEPELLLDASVSPHNFSLKPSQARLLQSADLIIWVGKSLEYPITRSVANLPTERSLALTIGVDEHGHEDEHDNVHNWLDPRAAKGIVTEIGNRLRILDPAHAALYDQNVIRMVARLDALETELAEQLHPLRGIPYIVFHDAYGPFERRFGLNNVGKVTKHAEDPPSAGHIRKMRAIVTEQKVRCAFREPQFEPHAITIIAEGNDLSIGELDPLGVGLTPGVNGYFLLMQKLGKNIAACLTRT
jgi:zinc transport system substrate-binding protein